MTLHACATGTALSEGFAPRQQHNNMESRKNIITKRGEGQCLSPQDRKAVTDIATFMELTEDCPSVNYPLCNLIPEIIAEDNIISSFNRVIKNLRQSATDAEKKDCVVIDGNEYTRRQARYTAKGCHRSVSQTVNQERRFPHKQTDIVCDQRRSENEDSPSSNCCRTHGKQ